jgi:hypothetical protein
VPRAHFCEQERLLPDVYDCLEASFKEDTILKAFDATGLSTFEPDVILKRFNLK